MPGQQRRRRMPERVGDDMTIITFDPSFPTAESAPATEMRFDFDVSLALGFGLLELVEIRIVSGIVNVQPAQLWHRNGDRWMG